MVETLRLERPKDQQGLEGRSYPGGHNNRVVRKFLGIAFAFPLSSSSCRRSSFWGSGGVGCVVSRSISLITLNRQAGALGVLWPDG